MSRVYMVWFRSRLQTWMRPAESPVTSCLLSCVRVMAVIRFLCVKTRLFYWVESVAEELVGCCWLRRRGIW